jgi:Family of unknown function (DUF5317)
VFILYAVPVGLVVGWLLGGRLSGLASLEFRWAPLIVAGLLVQVALFSNAVTARIDPTAGTAVYVASTAAVIVGVLRNLSVPGIAVVVMGAASNFAAIVTNGGFMPVSAGALAAQGRAPAVDFSNSRLEGSPVLAPLTDIFGMPTWMPFSNVFSVGDLIIGAGVVVVIVAAMRSRTGAVAAAA